MLRIKRIMFTLMASLGLLAPMAVPAIVYAVQDTELNIGDSLCVGGEFKVTGECTDKTGGEAKTSVSNYIKTAINLFSIVVGIIAVVMIIIGGVKYITSGGDAGNVTGAKNTILYAIIGLVIVALSQVIVQFVLGSFSS